MKRHWVSLPAKRSFYSCTPLRKVYSKDPELVKGENKV
jgi:hypothetical protein